MAEAMYGAHGGAEGMAGAVGGGGGGGGEEIGGHDHDFAEPTHHYTCPLCRVVARDPIQTRCGHSFCGSCWQRHVTTSGANVRCPVDNGQVDITRVFVDTKIKRIIDDLLVKCDNHQHGCEAVCELRDLQAHLVTCQYQMVSCDQLCGGKLLLWALDSHRREWCDRRHVTCTLCGHDMLALDLLHHDAHCPMVYVTCEWCHGELIRHDVDHHLSLCVECPAYCSFALHGCNRKVVRKHLREHHTENAVRHMELMSESLLAISDSVGPVTGRETGDPQRHRPYELHPALWVRVPTSVSDVTIPWAELPGTVYGGKAEQRRSIHDRVVKMENANIRVTSEITDTQAAINNDIRNNARQFKGIADRVGVLGVHFEQAEQQNEKSTAELCTRFRQEPDKYTMHIAQLEQHNGQLSATVQRLDKRHLEDEKTLTDTIAKLIVQMETLGRTCETQSKDSRVTKEALEKMIANKHVDEMRKLTNDNNKLSATVATMTGQMEELDRTCKNLGQESRATKEALEKKITNKHAEMMEKLTNENKKLSTTVERLSGEVAALAKTGETQARESRVATEALEKRHVGEVAKFTKDNKTLSDTVVQQTVLIEALVKNTESTDKKVKVLMAVPMSMDPTVDIVEDLCYRLPVYWSTKLEKCETKRSPRFYLPDGYRLVLRAAWRTGESMFRVGALLVKGEHDHRDGMWPWHGEVELVVRGEDGVVLGVGGVVVSVGDLGRTRPFHDSWGNVYFLVWKDLPPEKDQTNIIVTLSKD